MIKPEDVRIFFENKKLVYQCKRIPKNICDEAKNIFVEEMSDKVPENSTLNFLISKEVEKEEAEFFLREIHSAFLTHFKDFFQDLQTLD